MRFPRGSFEEVRIRVEDIRWKRDNRLSATDALLAV